MSAVTHLFTLVRGLASLEPMVGRPRRHDAAAGVSSPAVPGPTPRNPTQADLSRVSDGQKRVIRRRHVPQGLEQQGIGHRGGVLGAGSGQAILEQNFSQIGANLRFHDGVVEDAVGRITPGSDPFVLVCVSTAISRNSAHETQSRTIPLAKRIPFDELGRLPAPPFRRHGHA